MSLDGQAKLSLHLPAIAAQLESLLAELAGERVLFALHVFGEGGEGRGQYIANCAREDVKMALQELLTRWAQTGGDDGPYHLFRRTN